MIFQHNLHLQPIRSIYLLPTSTFPFIISHLYPKISSNSFSMVSVYLSLSSLRRLSIFLKLFAGTLKDGLSNHSSKWIHATFIVDIVFESLTGYLLRFLKVHTGEDLHYDWNGLGLSYSPSLFQGKDAYSARVGHLRSGGLLMEFVNFMIFYRLFAEISINDWYAACSEGEEDVGYFICTTPFGFKNQVGHGCKMFDNCPDLKKDLFDELQEWDIIAVVLVLSTELRILKSRIGYLDGAPKKKASAGFIYAGEEEVLVGRSIVNVRLGFVSHACRMFDGLPLLRLTYSKAMLEDCKATPTFSVEIASYNGCENGLSQMAKFDYMGKESIVVNYGRKGRICILVKANIMLVDFQLKLCPWYSNDSQNAHGRILCYVYFLFGINSHVRNLTSLGVFVIFKMNILLLMLNQLEYVIVMVVINVGFVVHRFRGEFWECDFHQLIVVSMMVDLRVWSDGRPCLTMYFHVYTKDMHSYGMYMEGATAHSLGDNFGWELIWGNISCLWTRWTMHHVMMHFNYFLIAGALLLEQHMWEFQWCGHPLFGSGGLSWIIGEKDWNMRWAHIVHMDIMRNILLVINVDDGRVLAIYLVRCDTFRNVGCTMFDLLKRKIARKVVDYIKVTQGPAGGTFIGWNSMMQGDYDVVFSILFVYYSEPGTLLCSVVNELCGMGLLVHD